MGAVQAIHQAALLRFRPILMTTLAAIGGALPLMLGSGEGAELRQSARAWRSSPGCSLSQLLTSVHDTGHLHRIRQSRRRASAASRATRAATCQRGCRAGWRHEHLGPLHPPPGRRRSLLTIGLLIAGVAAFLEPCRSSAAAATSICPTIGSAVPTCPAPARRRWRRAVATPLERRLGTIADVTEMTSQSELRQTTQIVAPVRAGAQHRRRGARHAWRRSTRHAPTCPPTLQVQPHLPQVQSRRRSRSLSWR